MVLPLLIMAGAAAATSLIGGGIGAQGAKQQAEATAASGRFNADMLDYRAQMYELQAAIYKRNRDLAWLQAREAARDKGKVLAATMGSVRAAYGANGLSLEGSPLDVLEATAREGYLDINKELYKGDVAATALTDQANMATVEAGLSREQATMARYGADVSISAGNTAAMASLISGVGGAASSFGKFGVGGSSTPSPRAPGSGTIA